MDQRRSLTEAMDQRRSSNDARSSNLRPEEFLPGNYSSSRFPYSPLRLNSLPPERSGPINPSGSIGELRSAFSRLSLSQSAFEHQYSPLRLLPPGATLGVSEMGKQEAYPLRGYCYSTAGIGGEGVTNAGLQRGLMGFHNGRQDLSGVHPNLIMGQRLMNYSTPLRGGGASMDSMPGHDFLRQNCPPDSGRSLSDKYSFLPSKKYLPEGFNDDASAVAATTHFSLLDVRGRIVSLVQDETGSRMLQERLKKLNEGEIEMVVSEVVVYAGDLIKNQFGSHFFKKLFGSSSEEQRTRIVRTVTENSDNFVTICMNTHGACTINDFLDNLNTPEQISMVVFAICHGIVRLANDSNGQHVVIQCVMKYSHEYIKYLLNAITNNFNEIATNKSGCIVLQRSFDYSQGITRDRLIQKILAHALHLAGDPFGNYVVQHLMSKNIPGVNGRLIVQLQSNFVDMSMDKYASHVVERLLVQSEVEYSRMIIDELMNTSDPVTLLTDPFANYVIQKALMISEGCDLPILSNFIMLYDSSMRYNRYGQRILSFLYKKRSFASSVYHS